MTVLVQALREKIGPRQIAYLLSLQDHEPHRPAAQRLLAIALGNGEFAPDGEDLASAMNDLMGTCWSEGFQGDATDREAVEVHLLCEILIQADNVYWCIAEQCLDAPDGGAALLSEWSDEWVKKIRGYMGLIQAQRKSSRNGAKG